MGIDKIDIIFQNVVIIVYPYLLVERNYDDEGCCHEGPASADSRPDTEPRQVQDLNTKTRTTYFLTNY